MATRRQGPGNFPSPAEGNHRNPHAPRGRLQRRSRSGTQVALFARTEHEVKSSGSRTAGRKSKRGSRSGGSHGRLHLNLGSRAHGLFNAKNQETTRSCSSRIDSSAATKPLSADRACPGPIHPAPATTEPSVRRSWENGSLSRPRKKQTSAMRRSEAISTTWSHDHNEKVRDDGTP